MTKNDEVENTPEQLLARAYALRSNDPDETLKLYADWAETYDQTMLNGLSYRCLLYTSPSPRDRTRSRMPSSA